MIEQISWSEYFLSVAVMLSVYYFIVVLMFYRDEIRLVLAGKREPFARDKVAMPESNS